MIKRRRKRKKGVYKYLVTFYFGGKVEKVKIDKEGKKEVILTKKSTFGNRKINTRIPKHSEDYELCDTFEGAKAILVSHNINKIVELKRKITNLNTKIKGIKELEESDL